MYFNYSLAYNTLYSLSTTTVIVDDVYETDSQTNSLCSVGDDGTKSCTINVSAFRPLFEVRKRPRDSAYTIATSKQKGLLAWRNFSLSITPVYGYKPVYSGDVPPQIHTGCGEHTQVAHISQVSGYARTSPASLEWYEDLDYLSDFIDPLTTEQASIPPPTHFVQDPVIYSPTFSPQTCLDITLYPKQDTVVLLATGQVWSSFTQWDPADPIPSGTPTISFPIVVRAKQIYVDVRIDCCGDES